MRDSNEKKEKFSERLCKRLDISADILPGGNRVERRGRGYILVSGCGRILLYTPSEIRVELSDSVLSIVGEGLLCVAYTAGEVGIEGKVSRVSFEEGER